MRSSMIGLAAATAVGISVVALPPAIAAHTAASSHSVTRSTGTPAAASVIAPVTAAKMHYPTNTTSLSLHPLSRSYPRPTKVTFSGRLSLNGVGIRTDALRIFSIKDHKTVTTVSTNRAGYWHAKVLVRYSDWYYAVFSGNRNYQPAMSGVARITIGNRPAILR